MKHPFSAAAVLLSLSLPAAAQDLGSSLDLSGGKTELAVRKQQQAAGKAVCQNVGTPNETCKCPQGNGNNGMRKLQIHMYAPYNVDFLGDQKANAVWAYGKYANVLLRNTANGSFAIMQTPLRAKTGKDPDQGAPNYKIDAFDELCAVVRDAFKLEPPKAGSIPVMFVKLGDGFKKSIFTHINGITMPKGLKARCDDSGEPGLPESMLVLIDIEPEQKHEHVLAHEVGHAIGQMSGASKRFFDDIYDNTSENIMVSARAVTREQMKLNAFQVKAVCDSPYVADVY